MDENVRKPGMVTGGRGEWIFICSVSLLLIKSVKSAKPPSNSPSSKANEQNKNIED